MIRLARLEMDGDNMPALSRFVNSCFSKAQCHSGCLRFKGSFVLCLSFQCPLGVLRKCQCSCHIMFIIIFCLCLKFGISKFDFSMTTDLCV